MDGLLGVSGSVWEGVLATVLVAGLYLFAALSRKRTAESGNRYSPIAITAGVFGRASLANLQVLFFSLIVFWVLVYYVLKAGTLAELSSDVLLLLGISAGGTAGAKVTATQKGRLTYANWSWLKRKGWIKEDIGRARRPPAWADLVSSEDTFDVFKFQTIGVSLIVGFALLYAGVSASANDSLSSFHIGQSLLGLLGLSQVAYVGGKAVSPSPVQELDKALTALRKLEDAFTGAVARSWATSAPPSRTIEAARKAAPAEYEAYMSAVKDAAQMLADRIGGRHPTMILEPRLPSGDGS